MCATHKCVLIAFPKQGFICIRSFKADRWKSGSFVASQNSYLSPPWTRGATSSSFRVGAIFMKFHSMTSSCLFNRGTTFSQTVIYNNYVFCLQTRSPQYKDKHSVQRWLIKTDKTERFTTALEAESPVSSEISDLRNFWLHAICSCTEQHPRYQYTLRKRMIRA